MSDGATVYVVQFLGQAEPARGSAAERISLAPETLVDELFRGLSAGGRQGMLPLRGQSPHCRHAGRSAGELARMRRVKVPVQNLIESIQAVVATGDKPKALVLLDALEACRDLAKHQLDCRDGLGKQLAHRLYLAAIASPNTREYHPTRSLHDRILQLLALGVTPDQAAFPQTLLGTLPAGRPRTDDRRATCRPDPICQRGRTVDAGRRPAGSAGHRTVSDPDEGQSDRRIASWSPRERGR